MTARTGPAGSAWPSILDACVCLNKLLYKIEDIENLNIKDVKKLYDEYVSSSQVKLLSSFEFGSDLPESSKGSYIYTKKGEKILDFTGGFGVLNHGHNHDRILNARINFQKKKKVEVHKNFL